MGIREHMELNSVSEAGPVMSTKQVCCCNFILSLTTGLSALYSVRLDSHFVELIPPLSFLSEELF